MPLVQGSQKEMLRLFGARRLGNLRSSHPTTCQAQRVTPMGAPDARPFLRLLSHFPWGLWCSHETGRGPRALSTRSPQTQLTELPAFNSQVLAKCWVPGERDSPEACLLGEGHEQQNGSLHGGCFKSTKGAGPPTAKDMLPPECTEGSGGLLVFPGDQGTARALSQTPLERGWGDSGA